MERYNNLDTIRVKTELTSFGVVRKAGTRVFAEDTKRAYIINVNVSAIDSLNSISDKSIASIEDTVNTDAIITDVLTLTPRATAPATPVEGMMYVDSVTDEVNVYLNGAWYILNKTLKT